LLDGRRLGKDVTAFIGVSSSYPRFVEMFETAIADIEDVLECHHVTGSHTFMIKVKTNNTGTLEDLISRIRTIDGVTRTETIVVRGLELLVNLGHRGGAGADPESGDGAGILIELPDAHLRREAARSGASLPARGDYAVAMVFLAADPVERAAQQASLESALV